MKGKVHFAKMHGAGNDYIYVDTSLYNIGNPASAARAWSDRHKGIGSDGLVLIGRSKMPEADFTMRIFNADGSEAMMCGNASRCVGKYVYERGQTDKTEIRLLTLSGVKILKLHTNNGIVESVTVDMGEPVFDNPDQFISGAKKLPMGTFVSMGNPHYVIFTDFVDDVETLGKRLENHSAFPERANIEFAAMRPDGIRVRVWERGSGITMACGTGACATAVAASVIGRAGRKSRIIMDGGELEIEWREEDNHVYMTGPAEFVFEGEIESEK
jgi:diaminopimelate epimerase